MQKNLRKELCSEFHAFWCLTWEKKFWQGKIRKQSVGLLGIVCICVFVFAVVFAVCTAVCFARRNWAGQDQAAVPVCCSHPDNDNLSAVRSDWRISSGEFKIWRKLESLLCYLRSKVLLPFVVSSDWYYCWLHSHSRYRLGQVSNLKKEISDWTKELKSLCRQSLWCLVSCFQRWRKFEPGIVWFPID